MKYLVMAVLAFSFSIANAAKPQPISGEEAKKLDSTLKKLIGSGLSGETPDGKKCQVTFETEDVTYRNKPTGEKYDELLIMSPESAYQDCGVHGINLVISKTDLEGKGDIFALKMGKSEIVTNGEDTFDNYEQGAQTYGRALKLEIKDGKATSVELRVMGQCTCVIGK